MEVNMKMHGLKKKQLSTPLSGLSRVMFVMTFWLATISLSGSEARCQTIGYRPTPTQVQIQLGNLGYYQGPSTGRLDTYTTTSLLDFQKDHFLPSTGTINLRTAQALTLEVKHAEQIRAVKKETNGSLVVLRLARQPALGDAPLYRLFGGGGRPVYSGDSLRALVQAINREAGNNALSVYLLTTGFSDIRTDAFVSSARIQQKQINPRVSLGIITETNDSADWKNLVFAPGVRFEEDWEVGSDPYEPYVINRGPHAGLFYWAFNFSNSKGRGRVKVFAKTEEIIRKFIQAVRRLFQSEDLSRMSAAEVVTRVRATLKTTYGLSDEDLEIQLGHTVVARLCRGYGMGLG
jgi:hypothetical protein